MTPDELATQVLATSFPLTRFRSGYDLAEVDDFLDDLATAVRSGVGPADLQKRIREVAFATTSVREGYDEGAVDDLLDALVAELEGLEPQDAARPPTGPQDAPPRGPRVEDSPSAVVENPPQGLLGRLFGRH